jgi:hypothetical protein
MAHGVRVLFGYHGNELGRFDDLAGKDQERRYADATLWALMNAEFFLINTDTVPIPGARRVVGPVKDAAGTTVSLFQLPGEHPFAWVAPAMIKYPDASVLEAFRTPNFPVRSVALFDTSSKVDAAKITALPTPLATTVHVDSYAPGHIAMTLSEAAPKASALVVSENYYPGWHATVDGKPAVAERADLSLMGIALPEGAKKIELNFSSDTYKEGKTITLLALAIAFLATLAGFLIPKRPEQAA